MAFKPMNSSNTELSLDSPETMLHDIRSKKIAGALAPQADVWREYVENALEKSDVAIRLPTGSGKTLVGIALGEWRRRKYQERVVYLCPTNQLVYQVAKQAKEEYGIDVEPFTGSQKEYSLDSKRVYRRKTKIAVTSYSALFNTAPFFENPDVIILDDAHVSENYIASMWSLVIKRDSSNNKEKELFDTLIALLQNRVPEIDLSRAQKELDNSSRGWVEKIPSHIFYNSLDSLVEYLNNELNGLELNYPWSLIKDNLGACHCYISATQILVRPLIPPTYSHNAFDSAKQRIYMSATLGNGGDLERVTGRHNIYRLSPKSLPDAQGIGRRFFVFPEVAFEAKEDVEEVITEALNIFQRGLFITPSKTMADKRSDLLRKLEEYTIFNASEIEKSKEGFINSEKAAAIMANRYDGIDFPHDECRLLILEGLSKATNLQETFLMSKMSCNSLFHDRIQTRIVQAIGRCTRANRDYATVIIKGHEWIDYLLAKDNARYLQPEIQAELDFGEAQSNVELSDLLENLQAFEQHDDSWKDADKEIIRIRNKKEQTVPKEMNDLENVVSEEIKYVEKMWRGIYSDAFEHCRNILGKLNDPNLKGYRALWNYLAGSALDMAEKSYQVNKSNSKQYYEAAMKAAPGVSWLVGLAKTVDVSTETIDNQDLYLAPMIENIESFLLSLGFHHNRRFRQKTAEIITKIEKDDAKQFESGQLELGRMIGFNCGNTEERAAPDPWWIISKDKCIVFEDHTGSENGILSVEKARQVTTHDNWIRSNVTGINEKAEILKILITPVKEAAPGAREHLKDVYILTPDEFRKWAHKAIKVIREIRKELSHKCDLKWREKAARVLAEENLTPVKILEFFQSQKASDSLSEKS